LFEVKCKNKVGAKLCIYKDMLNVQKKSAKNGINSGKFIRMVGNISHSSMLFLVKFELISLIH